jgi:outer membrane immunogenic protein
MRKFMLATVSILALSGIAGAADAQDLFSGPPVNWTGPYVGAEGGYGWGSSSHRDSTGFNSGSFGTGGGLAGGTAGFNWQTGPLVFGAEGDMSWTDMGGSTGGQPGNFCGGATPNCGTRLNDLGTMRARLGYSFGRIMPYATAGLAFGDLSGNEGDIPAHGAAGSGDTYRLGWTAGAGVEAALAPRWSVKLEYLHVDLGNGPVFDDTFTSGATAAQRVNFQTDIIRGGINYRF